MLAPPKSTSRRVARRITACTKRSVRIRPARRIHIARCLFDLLKRQHAVEAPNYSLLTFPPPLERLLSSFPRTHSRPTTPLGQSTPPTAIVTYILSPPSDALELALLLCSDHLSIPLTTRVTHYYYSVPALTAPCCLFQYAYPPPQLSRSARLTRLFEAGPSRSPHKHQHRSAGQHA